MEAGGLQDAGACADDAHNGSMRTCKTCRKCRDCPESNRKYPCRDWERRDKHDRRRERTQTGARADPAASRTAADHRPRTAQDHPAQAGAAGEDDPGLGDRIGVTVRDSPDSMGNHLHIAGGTHLKGKAPV